MQVTDIWTDRNNNTYGYCKCGREVKKGKDEKCPYCGAVLEWDNHTNASDGR